MLKYIYKTIKEGAVMMIASILNNSLQWKSVGLVILFLLVYVIGMNLPHWIKKGKKTTCHVRVRGKRVEYSKLSQRYNYIISFRDDFGKEINVCVMEPLYGMYKEGATGMLTYQGENLLEFQEDDLREC